MTTNRPTKIVPICLGEYAQGHECCDGAKGASGSDSEPCPLRDRCAAFKMLISKEEVPPTKWIQYYEEGGKDRARIKLASIKKFFDPLDALISKYDIVNGRARNPDGKPVRHRRDTSRKQKLELEIPKPDICHWFVKRLAEALGRDVATSRADARSGEIFLVDRIATSKYLSLYVKTGNSRRAIATVIVKGTPGLVEVRVAVEFVKTEFDGLSPEDYTGKDGAFNVRFRGLKRADVANVASEIARLAAAGRIALPPK